MKQIGAAFFATTLAATAIIAPMSLVRAQEDPTAVSQEYYWRTTSSALVRDHVAQLPADPVPILPIPVLFGVAPADLSPNFGDRRGGGRTHEGEDITAPKGVPIVSPTKAVVLDIGVWSGAGNYVATANPGNETFVYMHLDRPSGFLTPGDILEPGDLIGYVGNTGNAIGGAAHLHFEIRKNGATDPYPRLKTEFTMAQKLQFAAALLAKTSDRAALTRTLVENYRAEFAGARTQGLVLPPDIAAAMSGEPISAAPASSSTPATTARSTSTVPMPTQDLESGAQGAEVAWLQRFLVDSAAGPAAQKLAAAGATGYFGRITKTALAEYQRAHRISPASGYYGPRTRAIIAAAVR